MADKQTKDDLTSDHKQKLFNDFYRAALGTMSALEMHYDVTGVVDQIFGNQEEFGGDEQTMKANLRKSSAWYELSALYDYALHGIVNEGLDGPSSIVINGSDVLKLASSEEYRTSDEWDDIIAMGDGRYALDDGMDVTFYKLALLARVDQRTVRNAVSAGHLVANKKFRPLEGEQIYIENTSARRWLHGRKGFKPTVVASDNQQANLNNISNPAEFGAFLVMQRKRIGMESERGKLVVLHDCVDAKALAQIESGVFSLPLDAVFPLADFYQVARKELLDCVMRIFFADELMMLTSTLDNAKGEENVQVQ